MNVRAGPNLRDAKSTSHGRLLPVIWLFVAIVAALLALAIPGIGLLSAGRAYVGGEGLWSKAQKEAVIHLSEYLRSRSDDDYAAYVTAIAVPKGNRDARLELEKPDADLAVARDGLLRGRNHPDDIEGMITLFRRFRNVAHIDHAIGVWARADETIAPLEAIGTQARALALAGTLEPRVADAMLAEIRGINEALGPLEDEFSSTLGEAQRLMTNVLVAVLSAGGALLLLGGVMVWRRLLGQAEAAQRARRESESQMRQLIQSAPLPLLIARRDDGCLLYGNPRSQRRFGLTSASLEGKALAALFAEAGDFDRFLLLTASDQPTDEGEMRLQDHSGQAFWAVVSTQRIVHQATPAWLIAVHDIDERKRLQDSTAHRALHDELTRLPNRAMFLGELERAVARARRQATRFSVLFIDLDHFKAVNDTWGHAAGDRVLEGVAERIRAGVRQGDLVARLGGDEFVVLIEEHHDTREIAAIAAKLLERLQRPYVLDQREIVVTASIGISGYPGNGLDRDALVKNADLAMYRAKERGRNNFQFFEASAE